MSGVGGAPSGPDVQPPGPGQDPFKYRPGEVSAGRYQIIQEIASGGTATVYRARDARQPAGSADVALKAMKYTRDLRSLHKMVRSEVAFGSEHMHPNIARAFDVYADNDKRLLVIVWELVEGPDLLELINERQGALNEEEAAFYFAQVLKAVAFMHDNGYAHRDLKLENAVLHRATNTVKVIDFGLSKHIESARTLGIGTPEYMAPELIFGGAAAQQTYYQSGSSVLPYDARKVDTWALGVLLYVMVAAQYPFTDPMRPGGAQSNMRAIMEGRTQPMPPTVSQACTALIARMLVPRAEGRASLEEVASNSWLQERALAYASRINSQHLVHLPLIDRPVAQGAQHGRPAQEELLAAIPSGGGNGALDPNGFPSSSTVATTSPARATVSPMLSPMASPGVPPAHLGDTPTVSSGRLSDTPSRHMTGDSAGEHQGARMCHGGSSATAGQTSPFDQGQAPAAATARPQAVAGRGGAGAGAAAPARSDDLSTRSCMVALFRMFSGR